MKIFSDDVRKLMLAGLGAVASAVEKTGEKLDEILEDEKIREKLNDLAKKGEEILHGNPFDAEEVFTEEETEETETVEETEEETTEKDEDNV